MEPEVHTNSTASLAQDDSSSDNAAAVAFALVTLASLSTAVGASVVFFPALINLASPRTLAVSLGMSAGSMVFLSFIEIYNKSLAAFAEEYDEEKASILAMICFFGGAIFMEVSAEEYPWVG